MPSQSPRVLLNLQTDDKDELEDTDDVDLSFYELIFSSPYIGAIAGVVSACLTFAVLLSLFKSFRQADGGCQSVHRRTSSPDRPSRRHSSTTTQSMDFVDKEDEEYEVEQADPETDLSFFKFLHHNRRPLQRRETLQHLISSYESLNSDIQNKQKRVIPESVSSQPVSIKDMTDSLAQIRKLTQNRKRSLQQVPPKEFSNKYFWQAAQSDLQKEALSSAKTYNWSPGANEGNEVDIENKEKKIKLVFPQSDSFKLNITCLKIGTPERRVMLEDKLNSSNQDDQEKYLADDSHGSLLKEERFKELFSDSNKMGSHLSSDISTERRVLDTVPTKDMSIANFFSRNTLDPSLNTSHAVKRERYEGKLSDTASISGLNEEMVWDPTKSALKHPSSKHKLSRKTLSWKRQQTENKKFLSGDEQQDTGKQQTFPEQTICKFSKGEGLYERIRAILEKRPVRPAVDDAARAETSYLSSSELRYKRGLSGMQDARTISHSLEKKSSDRNLAAEKKTGFTTRFGLRRYSREQPSLSTEGESYGEYATSSLHQQTTAPRSNRTLTDKSLPQPEQDISCRSRKDLTEYSSPDDGNEGESSGGKSPPSHNWSSLSGRDGGEHSGTLCQVGNEFNTPKLVLDLGPDRQTIVRPSRFYDTTIPGQGGPNTRCMRESRKAPPAMQIRTQSSGAPDKHEEPKVGVDQPQSSSKDVLHYTRKRQIFEKSDTSQVLSERLRQNAIKTFTPASSQGTRTTNFCEKYGNSANALLYTSTDGKAEDNWTCHSGQGGNQPEPNVKQRITFRQCSAVRESHQNVRTFTLPRLRSDEIYKNINPSSRHSRGHTRSDLNHLFMWTNPVQKTEGSFTSFVSLNACANELKSLIRSTIMDMQKYKSHSSTRKISQLAASHLEASLNSGRCSESHNNLVRDVTREREKTCKERGLLAQQNLIHDTHTEIKKGHDTSAQANNGVVTLDSEIRRYQDGKRNNTKLPSAVAAKSETTTLTTPPLLWCQTSRDAVSEGHTKQQQTEMDSDKTTTSVSTDFTRIRRVYLASIVTTPDLHAREMQHGQSPTANLDILEFSQVPSRDSLAMCTAEATARGDEKVPQSKVNKEVPDKTKVLQDPCSGYKIQKGKLQKLVKKDIGEKCISSKSLFPGTAKRLLSTCNSEVIVNYIHDKYGKMLAGNKQKQEKIVNIMKNKIRKIYLDNKTTVDQHEERNKQSSGDVLGTCVPSFGVNREIMQCSGATFNHRCLTRGAASLCTQNCQPLHLNGSDKTNDGYTGSKYPIRQKHKVKDQSYHVEKNNDVCKNSAIENVEAPGADRGNRLERDIQQQGFKRKRQEMDNITNQTSNRGSMLVDTAAPGLASRAEVLLKTKEPVLVHHDDNKEKFDVKIATRNNFTDLKSAFTNFADKSGRITCALKRPEMAPLCDSSCHLKPPISPLVSNQEMSSQDFNASSKSKSQCEVRNLSNILDKIQTQNKINKRTLLDEIKRRPWGKRKLKLLKQFISIPSSAACLASPVHRSRKCKRLQCESRRPRASSSKGKCQQNSRHKHISPTVRNIQSGNPTTKYTYARKTLTGNNAEYPSLNPRDVTCLPVTKLVGLEDDNCSRASSDSFTFSGSKVIVLQCDPSYSEHSSVANSLLSTQSASIQSIYMAKLINSISTLISPSDNIKVGHELALDQGRLGKHTTLDRPPTVFPNLTTKTTSEVPLTRTQFEENNYTLSMLNRVFRKEMQTAPQADNQKPRVRKSSFHVEALFSGSSYEYEPVRAERDSHKWLATAVERSSHSSGTLIEDIQRESHSDISTPVSSIPVLTCMPTHSFLSEEPTFVESEQGLKHPQGALQVNREHSPSGRHNNTQVNEFESQDEVPGLRKGKQQVSYTSSQQVPVTLSPPSIIFDGEQVSYMEIIPKNGVFKGLRLSELAEIPFPNLFKLSPSDKIWTPETNGKYIWTVNQHASNSSITSSVSHIVCILQSSSSKPNASGASDSTSNAPAHTNTTMSLSDGRGDVDHRLFITKNPMGKRVSSLREPVTETSSVWSVSEPDKLMSVVKVTTRARQPDSFREHALRPLFTKKVHEDNKLPEKTKQDYKDSEDVMDYKKENKTLVDKTCQTIVCSIKNDTQNMTPVTAMHCLPSKCQTFVTTDKVGRDCHDRISVSVKSSRYKDGGYNKTSNIQRPKTTRTHTRSHVKNAGQEDSEEAAKYLPVTLQVSEPARSTGMRLEASGTNTKTITKPQDHNKVAVERHFSENTENPLTIGVNYETSAISSNVSNVKVETEHNRSKRLNIRDLFKSIKTLRPEARSSARRSDHKINPHNKSAMPRMRDGLQHNVRDTKLDKTNVINLKDRTVQQKQPDVSKNDMYKLIHFKGNPSPVTNIPFGEFKQTELCRDRKFSTASMLNKIEEACCTSRYAESRSVSSSIKDRCYGKRATVCSSKQRLVVPCKYTNNSVKSRYRRKGLLPDISRSKHASDKLLLNSPEGIERSVNTLPSGSPPPCKRYLSAASRDWKIYSPKSLSKPQPIDKDHRKTQRPEVRTTTGHGGSSQVGLCDSTNLLSKVPVPLPGKHTTGSKYLGRVRKDFAAMNSMSDKTSSNVSPEFSFSNHHFSKAGGVAIKTHGIPSLGYEYMPSFKPITRRLDGHALLETPHIDVHSSPKKTALLERSSSHNSSSASAKKSILLKSPAGHCLVTSRDLRDGKMYLHTHPHQAYNISARSRLSEYSLTGNYCTDTNNKGSKSSCSEFTIATNVGAVRKHKTDGYPLLRTERRMRSKLTAKKTKKINISEDSGPVDSKMYQKTNRHSQVKQHDLCNSPQNEQAALQKRASNARRGCQKILRASNNGTKQHIFGKIKKHVQFGTTVDDHASTLQVKNFTNKVPYTKQVREVMKCRNNINRPVGRKGRSQPHTDSPNKNIPKYSKSPSRSFRMTYPGPHRQKVSPEKKKAVDKLGYYNENKYLGQNHEELSRESITVCENNSPFQKRREQNQLTRQKDGNKATGVARITDTRVSNVYQTVKRWVDASSKLAKTCSDHLTSSPPCQRPLRLQKPALSFPSKNQRCLTSEKSNISNDSNTDDSSIFHNTTDDVSASAIFDNSSPIAEFPRRAFQTTKIKYPSTQQNLLNPITNNRQQDSLQKFHMNTNPVNVNHQQNDKCIPKSRATRSKRRLPPWVSTHQQKRQYIRQRLTGHHQPTSLEPESPIAEDSTKREHQFQSR